MYVHTFVYTLPILLQSQWGQEITDGERASQRQKGNLFFTIYSWYCFDFFFFNHMQVLSLKIICAYMITYIHALYTNSAALGPRS